MKLRNNKGSAFTVLIIVMALFTIFAGTIFMQINNQIKSNKNASKNISAKYASESGIEKAVLKIINQIEYKVNQSPNYKIGTLRNKKIDDEFADVKSELIEAYEELIEVYNKYNIFDDELEKLLAVILNQYISAEVLNEDINEVKFSIIQKLAIENDNLVKSGVKKYIYQVLDYINMSLIKLYNSKSMHSGINHGELEINTTTEWGQTYIDSNDVYNKFIVADNDEKYSYRLINIQNDVNSKLKDSIYELGENITKLQNNTHQPLLDKVNMLASTTVQNKLWDYLQNGVRYGGGSYTFRSLKDLRVAEEKFNDKFIEMKSGICKAIDIAVLDRATNDVENELYKIYIEEFNNYKSINDKNFKLLKQIILNLEEIKINLIELKCKLGYVLSDTSGEIIPPDIDIDNTEELYIELEQFEESLADNYSYSVNKIEKTPIDVTYSLNKIDEVSNLELEIVSIGNVGDKQYKRTAVAIFTTTKEGDKFITNYSIKSYKNN